MELHVHPDKEPQVPHVAKETQKPPEINQDVNLADLAVQKGEPHAQVSSDQIKSTQSHSYGEPPGIDYGKVFAAIGDFFSRVAKFAEDAAISIKNFFKNVTIVSKEPTPKSLQIATSNVGLDGAYGQLNKLFSQNKDPGYTKDYLDAKYSDLQRFLDLAPADNKKLDSFLSNVEKAIGARGDKAGREKYLSRLTDFLSDLDNRKMLQELSNVDIRELNTLNEAVFALHHFSKIQNEWAKTGEGSGSFYEFVKTRTNELIQERVDQIIDKDVCFLQEFLEDSSIANRLRENVDIALFVPQGVRGESRPSLMINAKRFQVERYPQGDGKKVSDFVEAKIEVPGLQRKQTLQIYDDGSFGSGEKFRAVIANDRTTGRKMLLCSVHIRGYGIGKNDAMSKEAAKDVEIVQKMIEKIASDHEVDGIVIGGDFNSVEEKVGDFESPLGHMSEYAQVQVKSDTEVAPSNFYQEGYALSRKIDHIFVRWVSVDGSNAEPAKGKVAHGRKGAINPMKVKAFDHEALSAKIKFNAHTFRVVNNPIPEKEEI